MSLDDTSDGFIFSCDGCGKVAEFPGFDFWRAVAELKARNWKFTPEGRGTEDFCWTHLCSRCRPKSKAGNVAFLDRKPGVRSRGE
jgi:hypothetical protein